LSINGTTVTSTAAELNILDGVTTTAAEINLIDGGTARGTTAVADGDGVLINDAGTMRMTSVETLSTYMSGKSVGGSNIVTTGALNSGSITSGFGNIDTGSSTITTTGLISGGSLDIDNVLINGTTIGHTDDTDLITVADGLVTVAGEVSMTTLDIGGTNITATAAELNVLDGITAVVGELNALDIGSTAVGTAVASKAMILDSNKDYTGVRNFTLSGELDAGSLDISGDADIDGTLETDALSINGTAVTSTAAEINLLDGSSANSVVNSKAVIYGSSGELAGTLSTAAQTSITSLGTLTALTVDDVAINGKVLTMTGSSDDTAVFTVGTNGTLSIVTTDNAAAAANIQITADGTAELAGTTVTLDSGGDIELEATNDINIPANVGLTFGNDGEKIEGDGTDLTIAGNKINLTAVADVHIPNNVGIVFGDAAEKIEGDGTDLTITGNNIKLTAAADIIVPADIGITFGTGEKIEGNNTDLTITSGADINLTATADINVPSGVGITFGDDGEKIEGDGTDLVIASSNHLTFDAGGDIILDAAGNDFQFKSGGTHILSIVNSSSDVIIKPIADAKDIIFQQRDGTEVSRIEDNGTFNVVTGKLAINGTAITSTAAELNKLDGVGTLKQAGKETIWVPAAAMNPTASNGCAALATVETTAGRPDIVVLDFDASSDEHAQFSVAFPKSYNLGTVTFRAYWTSTATDTGGCTWGLQGVAMNDNETIDVAYGTAVVVDDAAQSAAEELYVTAESGAITIAGTPADEDLCYFRVFRDVSDSNDDMAEDARLIGIKLFFTTDAANDA